MDEISYLKSCIAYSLLFVIKVNYFICITMYYSLNCIPLVYNDHKVAQVGQMAYLYFYN